MWRSIPAFLEKINSYRQFFIGVYMISVAKFSIRRHFETEQHNKRLDVELEMWRSHPEEYSRCIIKKHQDQQSAAERFGKFIMDLIEKSKQVERTSSK